MAARLGRSQGREEVTNEPIYGRPRRWIDTPDVK
jgi:hypothetical protein